MSLDEFQDFAVHVVAPLCCESLARQYDAYCGGQDIAIERKADSSPASDADRETEKALRALVNERYPDHGIWGEEFGGENLNREYVWVFDPLDGTKEFIARNPGSFGSLIGFMQNGKAEFGVIADPIDNRLWCGDARPVSSDVSIQEAVMACTSVDDMFGRTSYFDAVRSLQGQCKMFVERRNCIGFADIVDGNIDLVIENDLCLHDIAALIPVLAASGASVLDFEGNDYTQMTFDMGQAVQQKFGLIAACNEVLARDVLAIIQKKEAA